MGVFGFAFGFGLAFPFPKIFSVTPRLRASNGEIWLVVAPLPYVFPPVPDVKKVARQNEYSCIQSTFGVIFNPTPPSRSRVCRAPRVSQEATIRYQKIYVQALFV